jgi:hypothetical protein
VIIRITDGRAPGDPGSPAWWAQARKSAAAGRAPHGVNQLVLDSDVSHVDVFATEVSEVWRWAEQFPGWIHNGRKQLKGEPLDSLKSTAAPMTPERLRAVQPKPPGR